MELRVGSKIKDNDTRMGHRVLIVTAILKCGVRARDNIGREFTYKRERIFTDGKPRKIGLSVIR